MKILLLAAIIELPDDDDLEPEFSCVPNPAPFSPDELVRRLIREVREGRNPDIWREEPHGPIFQV